MSVNISNVLYTIYHEDNRYARIGNNNTDYSTSLNAVLGDFSDVILIHETIECNSKVYIVNEIGICAFRSCQTINTIIIPSSVVKICYRAFDCSSLKSVIFKKDSRLKIIYGAAFYSTKISKIEIPSSIETIGSAAFSKSLKAFYYCGSLEIKSQFFEGSNSKLTIYLSDQNPVTDISPYIFHKSSNCQMPVDPICKSLYFKKERTISTIYFIIMIL